MAALPAGWQRYTSEDGKEYFHHAGTNLTQWEKPSESAAGGPESLSFHSGSSEVYQYKPSDLELQDRDGGRVVGMSGTTMPARSSVAPSGKISSDAEVVSLHAAPGGPLGSNGSGSFGGNLVSGAMSVVNSEEGVTGFAGTMLSKAQTLFDVSSDDVLKRLRCALLPLPGSHAQLDFRGHPDFWGPFWVATTAVLFLAATGNFARLLEVSDRTKFKADYSLVGLGASMIYGCLIGVPFVARAALWCSGAEANSINFKQVISVYGYSLTSAIPVSILCLIPSGSFRWLIAIMGCLVSLTFIRIHLWTDFAVEAPSLKWKLVALFVLAQSTLFLVYRLRFFSAVV